MFCGRGMGGGRGGGGGMLRTVGRAVTRVGVAGSGIHDPFSSSTTTASATTTTTSKSNASSRSTSPTSKIISKPKSSSHLSLSSSVNSHKKNPITGLPVWQSSPEDDDCDWVSVDGIEDEGILGFSGPYILGPVPSEDEVEDAVYALQQVFGPASHVQPCRDNCRLDNDVADHVTIPGFQVSTDGSEMDWKEPSLSPYNSRMLLSDGFDRVHNAFHLLQTESSVQRMVKSLSSDKAVWDAVLNNAVVRELRESFSAGVIEIWIFSTKTISCFTCTTEDEEQVPQSPTGTSNSDSHTTANVVMWIFDTARAKFMEVIEKITRVVNELFQPANRKTAADAEAPDSFTEKLQTSFMLSIMVLLVVVVSRAHRA